MIRFPAAITFGWPARYNGSTAHGMISTSDVVLSLVTRLFFFNLPGYGIDYWQAAKIIQADINPDRLPAHKVTVCISVRQAGCPADFGGFPHARLPDARPQGNHSQPSRHGCDALFQDPEILSSTTGCDAPSRQERMSPRPSCAPFQADCGKSTISSDIGTLLPGKPIRPLKRAQISGSGLLPPAATCSVIIGQNRKPKGWCSLCGDGLRHVDNEIPSTARAVAGHHHGIFPHYQWCVGKAQLHPLV